MSDRQSIIGFTEAELGFFVAILLFAFVFEHRVNTDKPKPQPTVQSVEKAPTLKFENLPDLSLELNKSSARIKELESLLADSLLRRSQLASQSEDLQKQINQLKGLRSRQTPTCIAKKIEKGFLLDVTVQSANSFVTGEKLTDLDGLLNSVEPRLEAAEREGCVESVRVFYSDRVSTSDSLVARRALQQYFYIVEPERQGD